MLGLQGVSAPSQQVHPTQEKYLLQDNILQSPINHVLRSKSFFGIPPSKQIFKNEMLKHTPYNPVFEK